MLREALVWAEQVVLRRSPVVRIKLLFIRVINSSNYGFVQAPGNIHMHI